ncbi:DNA mismatch endonuclease Vsr [Mesorhizobium sp.]|uniref:very short patch repair endonuclease n=1 Tax=Mesorhizobium sp. TaxID=1871066 RepID=UPI000FE7F35C|nr:DNA mismatch endonuclease Vsr [Mesorhizobium sp.]RWQ29894.1 MAG: DNA mismatch endonuclease Vsr [Mesorhizobium sp.]
MIDRLSSERRSWLMSRVRGKNTSPEMAVRKTAHSLGYRFRLHRKDLPGSPDLVFPKLGAVVFVHGCFWHRHPGCKKATWPKSRVEYWREKFESNVARDEVAIRDLEQLGWKVLVVWQCETVDSAALSQRLNAFLDPDCFHLKAEGAS